ncbi:DMT family transporter [Thalassomonas viridans]|uniref:DMT family transporter n=2 Tax=Thalassomonas viridans TaxID=137584 RepID=A0AAE9ZCE8_9GAMM|nr:DMT family transporter [Thalassomonas viridans]WDE09350.1 DMT family transporter [Thalassomonas viridans]
MKQKTVKTLACTAFALLAFAGNSVLCRLALADGAIDAASFTAIRLFSGIIMLGVILLATTDWRAPAAKGSWPASFMLFLYAVTFSYAYISLDTGTGALILFGSVQLTMILASLLSGKSLHGTEWLGTLMAFSGFVYLVQPGVTAPSVTGFVLMAVAGIAWGIYTLKGRGTRHPLCDTSYNFLRTLPFVLLLMIPAIADGYLSRTGVLLAVLSGAITSGIGYAIWYIALRGLSVIQAAVVQLLVPVLAALGGVIFAREQISLQLVLSSLLVLGGILLVVMGRHYANGLGPKKTS